MRDYHKDLLEMKLDPYAPLEPKFEKGFEAGWEAAKLLRRGDIIVFDALPIREKLYAAYCKSLEALKELYELGRT